MPSLSIPSSITLIDWLCFTAVLTITFISVIYGHIRHRQLNAKHQHNKEEKIIDLLLMGRQLTLPLFVATLVSTWYGGIFGVTQISFEKGIFNFFTQGIFWYLSYLVFAFWMVKKITPYQAVTLPDLIGKMFGPKAKFLSSFFNFFNVVPIVYAISLGLFLQSLIGGSFFIMMLLGMIIVLSYSAFGGFRAVVFSDIVQFITMYIAVILITYFSISQFGFVSYLTSHLPESHFLPQSDTSWGYFFAWGLIAFSTLVDPNFYQRCFAAKTPQVAKHGIIWATVFWFFFDIGTTLAGMYARAKLPEASSQTAFLEYILAYMPVGAKGFILAGILATILSTIDSYVFIAGTTLSYDFLPTRFHGKKSLHATAIIFSGLLAVFIAYFFQGNIRTVWKTLGSYSAACLLLPVCLGHIFPRKFSDKQFIFACLLGIIATTYWRNWAPSWGAQIDELYIGCLSTALGLFVYHPFSKQKSLKI